MPDPALPASFYAEMKELERRVRALETSNQLMSSAIQGGSLTIMDREGNRMIKIGSGVGGSTLAVEGTDEGLDVRDDLNRAHLVVVKSEGMRLPHTVIPWYPDAAVAGISTAAPWHFETDTWQRVLVAGVFRVPSDALYSRVWAGADVGTTGEMRVTQVYNGAATDPKPMLNNGNIGEITFNWIHQVPLHKGTKFYIEVRRTSGTGRVSVHNTHYGLTILGSRMYSATANGL